MKTSPVRLSLVTAAVIGAAFFMSATAQAEDAPGGEPRSLIARRCKDDAEKLCPGIAPGGGRLAKCLRAHRAELAEACQQALGGPHQPAQASEPVAPMAATKAPVAAPTVAAKAPVPAPVAATKTPPAPPAPPVAPAVPRAAPPAAPAPAGPATTAPSAAMPMPGDTGAMMGMRRACATEIEKSCTEVPPGQGRIAACLNEHGKELSPGCKKAVNLVLRQMNGSLETHLACADDVEKLCGDMAPGAGRLAFCLGEHAAELSPACKKQIEELKAAGRKAKATATPPAPPAGD